MIYSVVTTTTTVFGGVVVGLGDDVSSSTCEIKPEFRERGGIVLGDNERRIGPKDNII